jgi:hypothetical protein
MGLIDFKNNILIAHSMDDLIHEISHIICGPAHNNEFFDICHELGGKKQIFDHVLDRFLFKARLSANVGNVTGIQNILLDYHLLQAYRKFSKKVLATDGHWEVKGDNTIRLFPTPRGSFPVMVEYTPVISNIRTPTARELIKRAMVAEAKIILGNIRSKFGSLPSPDGGSITLNGDTLRVEGQAEKAQVVQDAILLGEPLPVLLF